MGTISNPLELAQRATADYQTCYGSDLIAAILYGSAIGSEFDPKKSDINLLLVLKNLTTELVAKSRHVQRAWLKKRCSRPLFMDRNYIERSLDSYPMEFLGLKEHHTLLCGKDVLEDLPIVGHDVRLQVERELKGKWLHLLREWPAALDNPRHLELLIHLSLKDFAVSFSALLFLKGISAPVERRALFAAVAEAYGLADKPFETVLDAHRTRDKMQMIKLFEGYAHAIEVLIRAVDDLTV